MTEWHHEDDVCWVADCEVCDVPMVVWRQHGPTPPDDAVEHMVSKLGEVADARFGADGWSLDRVMRQIPNTSTRTAATPTGGTAASADPLSPQLCTEGRVRHPGEPATRGAS